MKNLFLSLATIMVLSIFITACSSSNTPSDKALELLSYIQDKDYESWVDELYAEPGEVHSEEDKQLLIMMFKEKGDKKLEINQGIESYEVIAEEIAENGNTATVTVNMIYGNGETDENAIKLVKNTDGEWKHKLK